MWALTAFYLNFFLIDSLFVKLGLFDRAPTATIISNSTKTDRDDSRLFYQGIEDQDESSYANSTH